MTPKPIEAWAIVKDGEILARHVVAHEKLARALVHGSRNLTPIKVRIVPEGAMCEWTDDGEGNFDTACGQRFTLIDGLPDANGMKFCCYCGLRIGAAPGAPKEQS